MGIIADALKGKKKYVPIGKSNKIAGEQPKTRLSDFFQPPGFKATDLGTANIPENRQHELKKINPEDPIHRIKLKDGTEVPRQQVNYLRSEVGIPITEKDVSQMDTNQYGEVLGKAKRITDTIRTEQAIDKAFSVSEYLKQRIAEMQSQKLPDEEQIGQPLSVRPSTNINPNQISSDTGENIGFGKLGGKYITDMTGRQMFVPGEDESVRSEKKGNIPFSVQQNRESIERIAKDPNINSALKNKAIDLEYNLQNSKYKQTLNNLANNFGSGILQIPQGMFNAVTYIADPESPLPKLPIFKDQQKLISKAFKNARDYIGGYVSSLPDQNKEDYTSQLTQGAGSVVGFMLAQLLTRGTTLPASVVSGLTGALSQSGNAAYQTYQKTGDIDKTYLSFLANIPIGASESFGLGSLMDKMDRMTKGGIRQVLKRSFVETLQEGGQEGTQSFSEATVDNWITDAKRDVMKETLEGLSIGAILGFGTSALTGGLVQNNKELKAYLNSKGVEEMPEDEQELNEMLSNFIKEDAKKLSVELKSEYTKPNKPDDPPPPTAGSMEKVPDPKEISADVQAVSSKTIKDIADTKNKAIQGFNEERIKPFEDKIKLLQEEYKTADRTGKSKITKAIKKLQNELAETKKETPVSPVSEEQITNIAEFNDIDLSDEKNKKSFVKLVNTILSKPKKADAEKTLSQIIRETGDKLQLRKVNLESGKDTLKPESKLKEETVDAKDVERVEYPESFDYKEKVFPVNSMIEDVFTQLGIRFTRNRASSTNSTYYQFELKGGKSFKLRVSDHEKPGINKTGDSDASISYGKETTPIDIINELRQTLPDDILSSPKPETPVKLPTDSKKPDKSFSSTQVNIPKSETKPFVEMANSIPEKELYTEKDDFGRELEPHITALYGLHTENADEVKKVIEGFGDVEVTLGKTSLFKQDDYDVLKADVNSPDLHKLNKYIKDNFDYTNDYDKYQPHVTIAYLKPGEGEKYVGDDRFEGKKFKISELLFSDSGRNKTSINLSGVNKTSKKVESGVKKSTIDVNKLLPPYQFKAGDRIYSTFAADKEHPEFTVVIPEKDMMATLRNYKGEEIKLHSRGNKMYYLISSGESEDQITDVEDYITLPEGKTRFGKAKDILSKNVQDLNSLYQDEYEKIEQMQEKVQQEIDELKEKIKAIKGAGKDAKLKKAGLNKRLEILESPIEQERAANQNEWLQFFTELDKEAMSIARSVGLDYGDNEEDWEPFLTSYSLYLTERPGIEHNWTDKVGDAIRDEAEYFVKNADVEGDIEKEPERKPLRDDLPDNVQHMWKFKAGDIVQDHYTGEQFEIIDPDKNGMGLYKNINDRFVNKTNAHNNQRYFIPDNAAELKEISKKNPPFSKSEVKNLTKEIENLLSDEGKTLSDFIPPPKKAVEDTTEIFIKDELERFESEKNTYFAKAKKEREKGREEIAQNYEFMAKEYSDLDKDDFAKSVRKNPKYYIDSNIDSLLRYKNRITNLNLSPKTKQSVKNKVDNYGVEMTNIESQDFQKWLSKSNVAMNTKTVEERKKMASDWLAKNKDKYITERTKEIPDVLSKYGWYGKLIGGKDFELYNRLDKLAGVVKRSSGRYTIYGNDGITKIYSGPVEKMSEGIEKTLKDFWYAKEDQPEDKKPEKSKVPKQQTQEEKAQNFYDDVIQYRDWINGTKKSNLSDMANKRKYIAALKKAADQYTAIHPDNTMKVERSKSGKYRVYLNGKPLRNIGTRKVFNPDEALNEIDNPDATTPYADMEDISEKHYQQLIALQFTNWTNQDLERVKRIGDISIPLSKVKKGIKDIIENAGKEQSVEGQLTRNALIDVTEQEGYDKDLRMKAAEYSPEVIEYEYQEYLATIPSDEILYLEELFNKGEIENGSSKEKIRNDVGKKGMEGDLSEVSLRPAKDEKQLDEKDRGVRKGKSEPKKIVDKDIDDALDSFLDVFDEVKPEGPAFQKSPSFQKNVPDPKLTTAANNLIAQYINKDILKLDTILSDLYSKVGEEKFTRIFPFIKGAYSNYIIVGDEDVTDLMDDISEVKNLKIDDFLNKIKEKENVSDTSEYLERDRNTDRDENGMGKENVPIKKPTKDNGQRGETAGEQEDTEQSDLSIPPDVSTSGGTSGDTSLFGNESELPNVNPSNTNRTGSSKIGRGGVSSKRSATTDAQGTFGEQFEQTRDIKQSDAAEQQLNAESIKADKIADIDNIRETLPYLLPSQHDDVFKAETRFFDKKNQTFERQFGKGILFTNATGTGKTLTGLGIIKRFVTRGKGNVLIVVPSDQKAKDWIEEAEHLNLEVTQLKDTKDAGKGVNVTSYANYRSNQALLERGFDLIVYDESHHIISGKSKETTAAVSKHHQIVKTYNQAVQQALKEHPIAGKNQKKIDDLEKLRETLEKKIGDLPYGSSEAKSLQHTLTEQYPEVHKLRDENIKIAKTDEFKKLVDEIIQRTKVIFLSASPFAYHDTAIYGDGTLFQIRQAPSDENRRSGYNEPGPYEKFFVENFGYRMRYNKLTIPGPDVDVGLMEREFTEKLIKDGVVSRKILDVDKDYSREFVLVDQGVGEKIDDAMDRLFDLSRAKSNNPTDQEELITNAWEIIRKAINSKFNYLYQAQLMESIKAKSYIPRIKQHLAKGRKVVVFHSYNNALPEHPFSLTLEEAIAQIDSMMMLGNPKGYAKLLATMSSVYDSFQSDFAEVINLDMKDLQNPRELYAQVFGSKAGFFNGTVPKKQRQDYIKRFQADESGLDIIIVQIQAGKEGISLHDTTGKHQRVLIDLALPVRPTDAIQTEGRIFRIGNMTNAIFEYPIINTRFERRYFASTIAKRSKTAENLALGNLARDLEVAFREGYLNPNETDPGDHQGVGGKESDARLEVTDEYDRAKTYYFARQKRSSKQKSAEGVDYFATPEPLGLKMAEFMDLQPGESALEPSAGHGAIARFFPITTSNTLIEPSRELFSQLGLNTIGDHNRLENIQFEDLAINNKYDGIATNPPFGKAGATAIEHLKKDFKHLRNRGRIVAIIPRGSTDKKLQDFLESEEGENAYLRATINLPGTVFERAGTSVNTQLVIIDKIENVDTGKINIPPAINLDLSDAKDIKEFFERLKPLDVPERITAQEVQDAEDKKYMQSLHNINPNISVPPVNDLGKRINEGTNVPVPSGNYQHTEFIYSKHTKTGDPIYVVKAKTRLDRNQYDFINGLAKGKRGYYSRFVRGFVFNDEFTAKDFQNAAENYIKNAVSPDLSFQKADRIIIGNIGDLSVKLKALEKRKEKVLEQIEKVKALGKGEDFTTKETDESFQPDFFGQAEEQAGIGFETKRDTNKERIRKFNDELAIINKEIIATKGDITTLNRRADQSQVPMFQKAPPVKSKEFKQWFGNSKMVDDKGDPLIAYHGTNRTFNEFRDDAGRSHDQGYYGSGYYFTFQSDPEWQKYAMGEAGYYGNNIMPVYLKVENPFDISKLSEYEGLRINTIGNESIVFLSNIAKEFPELSEKIYVKKRTYSGKSGEYNIDDIPISVLPKLISKYKNQLKIKIINDSNTDTKYKSGYVKSEMRSFINSNGEEQTYESIDWLGRYRLSTTKNGKQYPSDKSIEIGLIIDAIEKYDGISADLYPEGYMTRNPEITEAIKKKGHDGIVQSMYGDEVVVFSPNQIKSATKNQGTFDPNNPDIRYQKNQDRITSLADRLNDVMEATTKLRKSFPGIKIAFVDNNTIVNTLNKLYPGGNFQKGKDEHKAFFGSDGKVYINLDKADASSPAHEVAGHIFMAMLKRTNPLMYATGLKIALQDKTLVKQVKKDYPELSGDKFKDEVLAQASGMKFDEMFQAMKGAERQTWIERFKNWFKNVIKNIKLRAKTYFKGQQEIIKAIDKLNEDSTLDEWTTAISQDILDEKIINYTSSGDLRTESGIGFQKKESSEKAFARLVTQDKDLVSELLDNWNESQLTESGNIKGYHYGRDGYKSTGEDKGIAKVTKKEFIDWLNSENPLDPKIYSLDQDWIDSINKARSIVNQEADSPSFQKVNRQTAEFYSPLERIISNAKQEKFNAKDFPGWVKNQKGFKPVELEWIGLENFLSGKKFVTKSELLDYVKANKVEIRENILGGKNKEFLDFESLPEDAQKLVDEYQNDAMREKVSDEGLPMFQKDTDGSETIKKKQEKIKKEIDYDNLTGNDKKIADSIVSEDEVFVKVTNKRKYRVFSGEKNNPEQGRNYFIRKHYLGDRNDESGWFMSKEIFFIPKIIREGKEDWQTDGRKKYKYTIGKVRYTVILGSDDRGEFLMNFYTDRFHIETQKPALRHNAKNTGLGSSFNDNININDNIDKSNDEKLSFQKNTTGTGKKAGKKGTGQSLTGKSSAKTTTKTSSGKAVPPPTKTGPYIKTTNPKIEAMFQPRDTSAWNQKKSIADLISRLKDSFIYMRAVNNDPEIKTADKKEIIHSIDKLRESMTNILKAKINGIIGEVFGDLEDQPNRTVNASVMNIGKYAGLKRLEAIYSDPDMSEQQENLGLTLPEVTRAIAQIEQQMSIQEKAAFIKLRDILDDYGQELIKEGLIEESHDNYFPFRVLEFINKFNSLGTFSKRLQKIIPGSSKKFKGTGQVYDIDAVSVIMEHLTQNEKAIAYNKAEQEILQKFSDKSKKDKKTGKIEPGWSSYYFDPRRNFFIVKGLTDKAIADLMMSPTITDQELLDALREFRAVGGLKGTEYIIPNGLAETLSDLYGTVMGGSIPIIGDLTKWWKRQMVGVIGLFNIVFHARNMRGDNTKVFGYYPETYKYLPQVDRYLSKKLSLAKKGFLNIIDITGGTKILKTAYRPTAKAHIFTETEFDQYWKEGIEAGTFSGQFSAEALSPSERELKTLFLKPGIRKNFREAMNKLKITKLLDGYEEVARMREAKIRFALYSYLRAVKGMSPAEAHTESAKTMINYNHFTPFERKWLINLGIPFYSWKKGNIETMIKQLQDGSSTQRARVIAMMILNGLINTMLSYWLYRDDEERLQNDRSKRWISESFHIPTPWHDKNGNRIYIYDQTPMDDISNLINVSGNVATLRKMTAGQQTLTDGMGDMMWNTVKGSYDEVIDATNPFPKLVFELSTNRNFFYGFPLWKEDDPSYNKFMKAGLYSLGILSRNYTSMRQQIVGTQDFDMKGMRLSGIPITSVDLSRSKTNFDEFNKMLMKERLKEISDMEKDVKALKEQMLKTKKPEDVKAFKTLYDQLTKIRTDTTTDVGKAYKEKLKIDNQKEKDAKELLKTVE